MVALVDAEAGVVRVASEEGEVVADTKQAQATFTSALVFRRIFW